MGGIAKRAVIGVMRGLDTNPAAWPHKAMKLLHTPHNVGYVLDDVNGAQTVEGAVREGVGEAVKVANDVSGAGGVVVDADGSGEFADTAADVESSQGFRVSTTRMMKRE